MKFEKVIIYFLILLSFLNFKSNLYFAENRINKQEFNSELIQDDFYILGQGDILN